MAQSRWLAVPIATAAFIACGVAAGCRSPQLGDQHWAPPRSRLAAPVPPPPALMPRELEKTTLPEYVIEPPDILLIDAVKVVPKPPYRIEALDVLAVQVQGTLPDSPIAGPYEVQPGGIVDFGSPYGTVQLSGLSLEDARRAIHNHLAEFLAEPDVSVMLAQGGGRQQIAGEHLVGPDGKVNLGVYGKVQVTGLTQDQAKLAIEAHLSKFLEAPEVAVDVFAYNSKVYYIITQGAGLGDGVTKIPITGNETVIDALAQIQGMESVSSKRMWIARPAPYGSGCDQVLPIDWHAVSTRGNTATNYQLLPGDRLVIAEDRLVATDNAFGKFTAPFERMFGATLLGTQTARQIKFFGNIQGGGGGF